MTISFEAPILTEQTDRVAPLIEALRKKTPPDQMQKIIGNLREYMRLKSLAAASHDAFESELSRDEATENLWFELQGEYGKDWTAADVGRLIAGLEN